MYNNTLNQTTRSSGGSTAGEKHLPVTGEVFMIDGQTAFLILPEKAVAGSRTPWIWYAPTLEGLPGNEEKWMFERFLEHGIAVAGVDVGESFGSPRGRAVYSALYTELVEQRGLAEQACLLARSRGGLMLYNWAVENPESVACIAGIYPVCNLSSYPGLNRACGAYSMTAEQLADELARHNPTDRLAPLAKTKVPIFHICGDSDQVVPLENNSALVKERYTQLGGEMTLKVIAGQGHTIWTGWFHDQELVDFVITHAKGISGTEVIRPVDAYRAVVKSKNTSTYSNAAKKLRQWVITHDPYRPLYHFTGPESWINDPNGPIYYNGTYHLFYQYDPIVDGKRSKRCWGHAVSKDLVHWEDWPVAIWPDSRYDKEGVYSGNTFIHQGRITALYTGNVRGHTETYGMLAWTEDGGVTFRKKMVMDDRHRPNAHSPVHWDAQVWKEDDTWFQLIGGTTEGGKQGAAWLWTSMDLETWKLQRNIAPVVKHGRGFWELPYLVPLDGRHVLMVGAGNPYWIGRYDAERMEFTPQTAARSVDTGHYYSFNPHMVDDKGPNGSERRLMHGWATIGKPPAVAGITYWEHAHSIPRVITIKDDRLWQEPIPELRCLRYDGHRLDTLPLSGSKPVLLSSVRGAALEILATFDMASAQRCGVIVRANERGEGTKIWVSSDNTFGIEKIRNTHFLNKKDPVTLHVFVDRGILEVYCDGAAITHACFAPEDTVAVFVFSEGGNAAVTAVEAWKMKSMWE